MGCCSFRYGYTDAFSLEIAGDPPAPLCLALERQSPASSKENTSVAYCTGPQLCGGGGRIGHAPPLQCGGPDKPLKTISLRNHHRDAIYGPLCLT